MVQEAFSIQGGHTACPRGGDCLAVDMVSHVSSSKHPFYTSGGGIAFGAASDLDVAVFHFQLAGKNIRVGFVPDGNKDPLQIQIFAAFAFRGSDAHAGDAAVITQYFFQSVVPFNGDVVLGEQLVLEDFFGA